MEERTIDSLGAFYKKTDPAVWKGRQVSEELGPQYWYQIMRFLDQEKDHTLDSHSKDLNFVFLGYACDEGVRRNQGRVGASAGPLAIRKQLAKLALHFNGAQLWDAGDLVCSDQHLEQTQTLLAENIEALLKKSAFPIVLGGGHDVAYGHAKGVLSSMEEGQRLGILNFDAHFDLRPIDEEPNSGTPFYQLLTEAKASHLAVDYFVIGIQAPVNTPALFSIADSLAVGFVPLERCQLHYLEAVYNQLITFLEKVDIVYLTIDLDCFSAAYAPGVSAPSPIGLEPTFVLELLKLVIASKKLISMDVAELNPGYDLDQRTAKLAARLIEYLVSGLINTKH